MCGGQEQCIQSCGGKLKERDYLEDVSIDDSVILEQIFKK